MRQPDSKDLQIRELKKENRMLRRRIELVKAQQKLDIRRIAKEVHEELA